MPSNCKENDIVIDEGLGETFAYNAIMLVNSFKYLKSISLLRSK